MILEASLDPKSSYRAGITTIKSLIPWLDNDHSYQVVPSFLLSGSRLSVSRTKTNMGGVILDHSGGHLHGLWRMRGRKFLGNPLEILEHSVSNH